MKTEPIGHVNKYGYAFQKGVEPPDDSKNWMPVYLHPEIKIFYILAKALGCHNGTIDKVVNEVIRLKSIEQLCLNHLI